ncbi:hypothetical protein ACLOJK_006735 [Asimina triloba]
MKFLLRRSERSQKRIPPPCHVPLFPCYALTASTALGVGYGCCPITYCPKEILRA